ncbi:MAG TPA: glycoside hydrolase family 44 protein [Polyangiales bacterium]|nr:glycoside hydrolase family 44 protein [Polyangiales bacterium]
MWKLTLLVIVLAACASDPEPGQAGATAPGGKVAGRSGSAGASGAPATTPDDPGEPPRVGTILPPGDPGSVDVTLDVRTDRDARAISPLIYGANSAPELEKNRFTVVRSGGNRMTAYNWENNASNAGKDYMFQNDGYISSSNEPAKPILDGLTSAASAQAAAIVTIPLVDYVSADKNGGGDVRNSGSNYLMTRFKQNKAEKGSSFADKPDASDMFVYQDEFVAYLKAHGPKDTQVMFSLDNEPDLWSATHAEVFPQKVTYADLWERSQRFARAIKQAWAEAPVLGPVSYGWNGFLNLQNATDASGRDFLNWYLDQAAAAEADGGKRLIDYLDLHWYPEARGGGTRITETSTAPAVVEARVQAPRSLWDASYDEQSWVHDNLGGPIDLIHRMQKKIDAHYPGTKLAFTEWNYGGGAHISGALACADVLGIFGREGVALATYWPLSGNETYAYAAFRAFRNYDGNGAAFGKQSVNATSSDTVNVTAYASLRGEAGDVVIVIINKATAAKNVGLRVSHDKLFKTATIYQLTADKPELIEQQAQTSMADNAWRLMLPAQTVSVVALKK